MDWKDRASIALSDPVRNAIQPLQRAQQNHFGSFELGYLVRTLAHKDRH
jgi:hypothetical protein